MIGLELTEIDWCWVLMLRCFSFTLVEETYTMVLYPWLPLFVCLLACCLDCLLKTS